MTRCPDPFAAVRSALALLAVLLLAACAHGRLAPPTAAPELAGTRWGLLVVDERGREVAAIRADERFLPASNSKIPVVLANLAMPPAPPVGTVVAIEGADVVLVGAGDPWLSAKPDCVRDCLARLADAVASRTRTVRDVIGDDRHWPDARWGPGWSWNNLSTRSGTAISALSLDDNVMTITVSPGGGIAADGWYRIDNRVTTGNAGKLNAHRLPGDRELVVTGTIAGGAEVLRLSVDDPAHWTAHRFAAMLRARGVSVTGAVRARHRLPGEPPPAPPHDVIARLDPPPLDETLTRTMKVSQNLYAEMLLRRAGGPGATAALFERAGAPRAGWDFSDGSGMSTYNRLSPRAAVALLQWAAAQPFADRWRAMLPVAGVDGTLAGRFKGTALEGRLFAKTGSLNGTSALSGYMTAASGRTLTFSIFANDVPSGAPTPIRAMDATLESIAAAN